MQRKVARGTWLSIFNISSQIAIALLCKPSGSLAWQVGVVEMHERDNRCVRGEINQVPNHI